MNRPLFRATIFGAKARTVLAVPLLIPSNVRPSSPRRPNLPLHTRAADPSTRPMRSATARLTIPLPGTYFEHPQAVVSLVAARHSSAKPACCRI